MVRGSCRRERFQSSRTRSRAVSLTAGTSLRPTARRVGPRWHYCSRSRTFLRRRQNYSLPRKVSRTDRDWPRGTPDRTRRPVQEPLGIRHVRAKSRGPHLGRNANRSAAAIVPTAPGSLHFKETQARPRGNCMQALPRYHRASTGSVKR